MQERNRACYKKEERAGALERNTQSAWKEAVTFLFFGGNFKCYGAKQYDLVVMEVIHEIDKFDCGGKHVYECKTHGTLGFFIGNLRCVVNDSEPQIILLYLEQRL